MSLTYPVDFPGYAYFPGVAGNNLTLDRSALSSLTSIEYIVRVRPEQTGSQTFCGWTAGDSAFRLAPRMNVYVMNAAAAAIGNANADADIPNFKPGVDIWLRAQVVVATAVCTYWHSYDDVEDLADVTWIQVGTPVTGTGAGTAPKVATSTQFFIGGSTYTGRMYYCSEVVDGAPTIVMDASKDLAGVQIETVTTFPASVGGVFTVNKQALAVSQGYIELPGTTGNYMETPDVPALDIAGDHTLYVRARSRDATPLLAGSQFLHKINTYAWLLATGGGGSFFWNSTGGALMDLSASSGPYANAPNETWVWYAFTFEKATRRVRTWVSTTDSLTPPPFPGSWTALTPSTAGATTVISTSDTALRLGQDYDGDIGYVGLSNAIGAGGDPVSTDPVLLLNAQSFVGLDPTALAIPATPGVLTVHTSPSPKGSGGFLFPGTKGNYLSVPDATNLRFTSAIDFILGMAPKRWKPSNPMGLVAKWQSTKLAYLFKLNTSGSLTFAWSNDGLAAQTHTSSVIPGVTNGVKTYVRVVSTVTGGDRTSVFQTSTDLINWTAFSTVTTTGNTGISPGTAPLHIGVQTFNTIVSVDPYEGEISYVNLNGTLVIDSEDIPTDIDATEFPTTGGLVSIVRTPTPIEFGAFVFPGNEDNYLSVVQALPASKFVVEARIIPDDWSPADRDRRIIARTTSTPNLGWEFCLSPRGTLVFKYSTDGNAPYDNYLQSVPVTFFPGQPKRVAFSFDSVTARARFWTGDDNVTWTQLGGDVGPAGFPYNPAGLNTDIGRGFKGRITNVSIRSNFDANMMPLQNTEMLLIDQQCMGIIDSAPSFVATTGQTVTVVRATTAVADTVGEVIFPGTPGNFLTTPTLADINNGISIRMMIAPERWKGTYVVDTPAVDETPEVGHYEGEQTILGRWSPNNFGYLLRIGPDGQFIFTWTNDAGTTEYSLATAPIPELASATDGEFRFFAVTVQMGATQNLRVWETTDLGDTWTQLAGATVGNYPATAFKATTAPLFVGGQDAGTGVTGPGINWFSGRMRYLSIREGVGADGIPQQFVGNEFFLIDAEALQISPIATTFIESATGKVVTIRQSTTPVVAGYLDFKGKANEYCRVTNPPVLGTGTGDLTIYARIDFERGPDVDIDEFIVGRWGNPATNDQCFALMRNGDKFGFFASTDGKDAAIGAELEGGWYPDEESQLSTWGWIAVTVDYQAAKATVRWFTAPDSTTPYGMPVVPTTWALQGTVDFANVLTRFDANTVPITIGADYAGTMPLYGKVSHVSIRNGIGTAGVPGGTEVYGFNQDSFYGITSDSDAFYAKQPSTWNTELLPNTDARTLTMSPTPPGPMTQVTPSGPGPATDIEPAPPGPETDIIPAEMGPLPEITPSQTGPTLELVPPSLDRPWWPGSQNADTSRWWERPAFTVQRKVEGIYHGGDYVRGSTNLQTEATAIRFPTRLSGWTAEGVGKGLLYAKPVNYECIELEWNLPSEFYTVTDDSATSNVAWSEVAIIRSSFGWPSTVNDGQAIMRAARTDVFPNGLVLGAESRAIYTQNQYDPAPPPLPEGVPGLPPGRFYYYALFFKIGKEWVRSAVNHALLPRDFGHHVHLWNLLPPYYRWLDERQAGGSAGDLKKFLAIFGYELDYVREFVEQKQLLYNADFCPMPLLRHLGENFGVRYEPGVGDIRFRSLVSRITFLHRGRGTVGSLRSLVAAASKCDCDVTMSGNMLLLPDNSDFYEGSGTWAGIDKATTITGASLPPTWLPPEKVRVGYGTYGYTLKPKDGRGLLQVWTAPVDGSSDIIITCGDGITYFFKPDDTRDTSKQPVTHLPRFTGIPVEPKMVLGFAVWVGTDANVTARAMWIFFDKDGTASDYISYVTATGTAAPTPYPPGTAENDNHWKQASVDATVPDDAVYAVPAIILTGRATSPAGAGGSATQSPHVYFSGASVYYQGTIEEVSTVEVVHALTLTGPTPQQGEIIGAAKPAFQDHVLGLDKP